MDYDSATDRENSVSVHAEDLSIISHRTFSEVEDEKDYEAADDGVDIDYYNVLYETCSVHIVSAVRIVIMQLVWHSFLLLFSSIFAKADVLVIDRPYKDKPVGH